MKGQAGGLLTACWQQRGNRAFPHPEEARSAVSKDEAKVRASWFETSENALLTMRGKLGPDRLRRLDDIQMNAAAARAPHGPVFGSGAARDDAQHGQAGAAI